mmetsp:Transcript_15357/g.25042  ORF Transcript_15357/g.25042 Transcript_15357/m.25042 type:complete len:272 (-) Transcript_15357:1537-2352(-)
MLQALGEVFGAADLCPDKVDSSLEEAVDSFVSDHDVNGAVDPLHGWTPLHVACYAGNHAVVDALVRNGGANVDAKTKQFGHTPLHIAASVGNATVVKCLLVHQARLQVQDDNGYTSLHHAAAEGYRATVELLLEEMKRRAVHDLLHEVDKDGNTPLALAHKAQNGKVAHVLESFQMKHLAHKLVDENEVVEVSKWLKDTVGLAQYVPAFVSKGYTRLEFWSKSGLLKEDFETLGITLPGHQRMINKYLLEYSKEETEGESDSSSVQSEESD